MADRTVVLQTSVFTGCSDLKISTRQHGRLNCRETYKRCIHPHCLCSNSQDLDHFVEVHPRRSEVTAHYNIRARRVRQPPRRNDIDARTKITFAILRKISRHGINSASSNSATDISYTESHNSLQHIRGNSLNTGGCFIRSLWG